MAGHFSEDAGGVRPARKSANIRFFERIASRYALFFEDFEASMSAEGEWLERRIGPSPLKVLDACCGSGRQAVPLAARGHLVTAADPCQSMLAEAKVLAARHGVEVEFVSASFFELGGLYRQQFDLVVAMGNGLCHLSGPAEIRAALSAFRACLKSGACIVGIKHFEDILTKRQRLHPHGRVLVDGEPFVLFDLWTFRDPFLFSTAILSSTRDPRQRQTLGTTCEYMLRGPELVGLAGEAGFATAEKLAHPQELVYRFSG